jgi:hypothetical protein
MKLLVLNNGLSAKISLIRFRLGIPNFQDTEAMIYKLSYMLLRSVID